ncbi:MAG: acyl-CoA dehydrogenase family protein [Gemmatimonadetes bacterium]|nr:acyl-CoA dehydrogenase family protein [Gemmatimonadota bacterium]
MADDMATSNGKPGAAEGSAGAQEVAERGRGATPVSEREARQVAEAARETEWSKPSFVRQLFLGKLRLDLIHPPPEPDPEEQRRAAAFMAEARAFLDATVDPEEIDRTGKLPDEVIDGLRRLGAMGMKIPREYGGLGFSQTSYNRAIALFSTYSPAIGVLLSAHQSIGVPQPLKMFGTEAQKKKYLPRLAAGAISAFALTEPDVGSDPARLSATADPTEDGEAYILNGEKLWCTNGPIAEIMVVMARTPAPKPGGRRGITAFIVESSWPGVEVVHRCEFMGLNGIENGVIRFTNVRVPKENVLWGEGKGLKLALITLNTGRLTIPATCAAAGKWCLEVARQWSNEREQWGAPIGKHEAVADMLADIAASTFAMDAIAELSAALADAGKSDIRLEAAIAKMFNSEAAWRTVDLTVQIRGGRGYETARSLAARGEKAIPVERVMRDLRINMIFEGSSEIMRLFIAREAVDPHLSRAGAFVDTEAPLGERLKGLAGLTAHIAGWVPPLYVGWGRWPKYAEFGPLATHLRFTDRAARKLARTLFWAMARFGPRLEKKQAVLFRLVDIGAELFAIAAVCVHAHKKLTENPAERGPIELADLFCRGARRRVRRLFADVFKNHDDYKYRVAQNVLKGKHVWLEAGDASPRTARPAGRSEAALAPAPAGDA